MQILNVHIEDVTIITHILLSLPTIYHELVDKKLSDYLNSNFQGKSDVIFFSYNHKIG